MVLLLLALFDERWLGPSPPAESFALSEAAWRYVKAWYVYCYILSNVTNAEVRNRIYEFVLQNDAQPVKLKLKLGFPTPNRPKQSRYAALTRVCRQIRFEYRPRKQCSDGLKVQRLTQSCSTAAGAKRFEREVVHELQHLRQRSSV